MSKKHKLSLAKIAFHFFSFANANPKKEEYQTKTFFYRFPFFFSFNYYRGYLISKIMLEISLHFEVI